jgi:hypothetical protein
MMSSILWDRTPCNLLEVRQHINGACCFHLHGSKIGRSRNHCEVDEGRSSIFSLNPVKHSMEFPTKTLYAFLVSTSELVFLPPIHCS